jgi:hypothetical protein
MPKSCSTIGEVTIFRMKQEEVASRAQYHAAIETDELRILSFKDTLATRE